MIMAFRMALRSISGNKMRAALTMLGIIIGVMALVVLVSLVDGATTSVTDSVSSLGSNSITVTISDNKGKPIYLSTLEEWVEDNAAIGSLAPYTSTSMTARGIAGKGNITVYGASPAYYDVQDLQLSVGRFLKNIDLTAKSKVCVINTAAAEDLVGYADCVGQTVALNGVQYEIVGVLKDDDESLTAIFSSDSMVAYVPYSSLIQTVDSVSEEITSFYVGNAEGVSIDDASEAMNQILLDRFEEDEDAFSVSSQNVLEDAMSSITSVLTILLGGIAGISLIVGGIGIMNIMLVTVTERTREIGIRKAIGASRGSILTQFLMEAVVLCMIGCGLGIFLSWAILQLVSTVVASLELKFTLNATVVGLSVGFCFFIGVVFGLYPANKAAKMKPIDALHYGG